MNEIAFALRPFDNNTTAALPVSVSGTLHLQDKTMNICYRISGDVNSVHLPAISSQPSRKNELWNSTCCELFVGQSNKSAYWEYNLSPSHDWAIFRFTDYRQNKTDDLSVSTLNITTKIDNSREFALNTVLTLPDELAGRSLDVGITTVIQDRTGNIYYYALSHMAEKPDFHQRNSFTIHISARQTNQ